KQLLRQGNTVFETAIDTGLSGPGRLHDLCVSLESATPGEIRNGGAGLKIIYGFGPTPFGECILASSERGICYLAFIDGNNHEEAIKELKAAWPRAELKYRESDALKLISKIFNLQHTRQRVPLRAFVKGTDFQLRVWRALLQIGEGNLVTYGDLAAYIDRPRAARAVGTAVGANPLAYLIPCHRVIRNSGVIGDYRWGSNRKKIIIACETARGLPSVASDILSK
ncbi:MAG: methylated-DNA--[protein]-cysteine S-methyltransferase, partial [Gammaproteobacteria bacterium]